LNALYIQITENGNTITYFETSDYLFFAFLGIIIFISLLILFKFILGAVKSRREAMKELENFEEAPLVEINASVLKKECFVKSYGVKMPETRKEFYITFLTFDGETKRYSVSEEIYLSIEEGVSGTIGLINNNFFDFYFK